jgi:hypothetical protein
MVTKMGRLSDKFVFLAAFSGYKEGEDPGAGSGSIRVVWYNMDNLYIVIKLFVDTTGWSEGETTDQVTFKVWKTDNFQFDRMKWASSANRFEPTPEMMDSFVKIRDDMYDLIQ